MPLHDCITALQAKAFCEERQRSLAGRDGRGQCLWDKPARRDGAVPEEAAATPSLKRKLTANSLSPPSADHHPHQRSPSAAAAHLAPEPEHTSKRGKKVQDKPVQDKELARKQRDVSPSRPAIVMDQLMRT